jgi:magnesium chelatase accessory protein
MSRLRWEVEGRDWPNRAHSRFVSVGAMRWHVQEFAADREDAPAMLLLHGTGAATHSWRALASLLAGGLRVIAIDLPGHGFTSGRPTGGHSMRAMARAVGALVTMLEVSPDIIVGHSAGAALAIRMALDGHAAPQRIVGLSAALLPFPGLAARLFPALAKALFVNPLAPHIFARMARGSGETGRFLKRSTGSQIDPVGVALYERLLATSSHCGGALAMMAEWDLAGLEPDLPRLTTPLLLIHGDQDTAIPLSNARDAATRVGDGRLTTLPGLGHLAHEERPEEVAAIVGRFVGEA